MNLVPVSVARWPRSTAALFTVTVHLMPVAVMLGMASSNQQVWQQISIDAPVITASLITQVAAAPEPVLIPTPVISPPEPAPKPQPRKPAPAPVAKPPAPVVPPPETAITQQKPPEVTTEVPVAAPVAAASAAPAPAPAPGPVDDKATKTDSKPASAPVAQHRGEAASAMNRQAQPDHAYNPPPPYPPLLRQQGISGVVTLRVLVSISGRPQEVTIHNSSGYRLMDDAAVRAVKRWRFIPALNNGQPEPGWVEFPIRFSLKDN